MYGEHDKKTVLSLVAIKYILAVIKNYE